MGEERAGRKQRKWVRRRCVQAHPPRLQGSPLSAILRAWTATLDAIEDFISVHDWEFRIVRVNRALARRLGREPAELIGQRCYRLFHGSDEPPPDCPHGTARETGRTSHQEILNSRLGVPLRVTCSPYHDEQGRPVGTVHVAMRSAKS